GSAAGTGGERLMSDFTSLLPAMRAEVGAEHAQTLDDLRRLVEIETPSSDREALTAFAAQLLSWVSDELGPLSRAETIEHAEHGPTLIAEVPGSLPGRVVIVGHYDTVWPLGALEAMPFS